MEKFKQRLIDFARARYDMGQTRFEDYCGLAHGTISAIKAAGPSAGSWDKKYSRTNWKGDRGRGHIVFAFRLILLLCLRTAPFSVQGKGTQMKSISPNFYW